VNIPGLEFKVNTIGSLMCAGCRPTFPSLDIVDAWLSLNTTLVRIPVGWNYLQSKGFPTSALDLTMIDHLDKLVQHITSDEKRKAHVIIDIVSWYQGSCQ
jgi:hypothetical protein